jgi:glutamine amidotransferase
LSARAIAVVDAGLGNLRSVMNALTRAAPDADVRLTTQPAGIADAARVVVPGQGAFGECARALRPDEPLGRALFDSIAAGKPYLGICLGMQILFSGSDESPGHPGLGHFPGRVRRLPADRTDEDGRRIKVPHVGWSRIALRGAPPLLGGLDAPDSPWFYFVHSYHACPDDESLITAVTPFGAQAVTAAVGRGNVVGVQFHPEKSQAAGAQLLAAFARWRC